MTKVAVIQMCSSHLVVENLLTTQNLIEEAANNNAKLIVLPEMFAVIGSSNDKVVEKEVFAKGKIQSFLSEQAQKHRIWIVGGTIPLECTDTYKIRAASLIFDDNGKIVSRYDKIHLFDVSLSGKEIYEESNITEPGTELVVVDTPFGKIGQSVCYDIRFPELFRCLFNKGAEIIVIPSAFTLTTGKAHWELLSRSRAIENFCYVLGACQGGTHSNGRKTYGNSLIVEPWGNVIAKKESIGEGVIYADIDLNKVYEIRKSIPIANHQRIFFDLSNLKTNTIN